ncbi:hypothetical protein U1Q18_033956 [Sarracenia purpurea var. burkii]
MGCFLACFGSSKDRQRRTRKKNKVLHRDQRHGAQESLQSCVTDGDLSAKPTNLISEVLYNLEEPLISSTRKKVTFDTNVKTYAPVPVHESTELLPERGKDFEKEKEDSSGKSSLSHSLPEDDSITSGGGSYPPNHRYQNCRDSDDEAEEFEDEDSDLDYNDLDDYGDYDEDEEGKRIVEQEMWSDTIPTASMESIMRISPAQEVKSIGSNRNARDRSGYVHSVLNPVENITQWKAVKLKGTTTPPLKPSQKENLQESPRVSFSCETTFKQHPSFGFVSKLDDQFKNQKQEIAVDASLSNWLVTSGTTNKVSSIGLETISSERSISQGSNSMMSNEDRPILGALTVEELKQFSASSSPRRSPSRSPDEMPIIGSVGTYWRHTGPESDKDSGSVSSYKGIPNTNSKYREVFVE